MIRKQLRAMLATIEAPTSRGGSRVVRFVVVSRASCSVAFVRAELREDLLLRFAFRFSRRRIPHRSARIAIARRSICFRSATSSPDFGVVLFSVCG